MGAGAEGYRTTNESFGMMPMAKIRDPLLAGGDTASLTAAADALDAVATGLATVNDSLSAVERSYAEAHQGDAAEQTKMYLRKLGEPGRVGALTFTGAARALRAQADHYVAARARLESLDPPSGGGIPVRTVMEVAQKQRRLEAAEIATGYQADSNATITAFESFAPISLPTPDGRAATVPEVVWPSTGGPVVGLDPASTSAAPGSGAGPGHAAVPAAPMVPGADGGDPGRAAVAPTGGASTGAGPGRLAGPRSGADPVGLAEMPATGAAGTATRAGMTGATGSGLPGAAGARAGAVVPGVRAPGVGPFRSGTRSPASAGSASGTPGGAGQRAPDRASIPRSPGGVPTPRSTDGASAPRSSGPRSSGPAPEQGGVLRPRPAGAGEPWTGGRGAAGPGGAAGERLGAARPLGERAPGFAGVEENPRAGTGARQASSSHLPFVPGGAAGTRPGESRARPDWLVEDDPEGVWLGEVPPYGPPVLGRDV
ncbi:hypothetical protein [Pseudonocardia xishanensis]|uniref:PPE family protein n=1 Tax=Pseudonocardia xishanensis TaxID=630995 RepID=A0ABP8RX82_9PSEU